MADYKKYEENVITYFRWKKTSTAILVLGICICWFLPNSKTLTEKFRPKLLNAIYASALMLICLLQMNKVVQFLYFQF